MLRSILMGLSFSLSIIMLFCLVFVLLGCCLSILVNQNPAEGGLLELAFQLNYLLDIQLKRRLSFNLTRKQMPLFLHMLIPLQIKFLWADTFLDVNTFDILGGPKKHRP